MMGGSVAASVAPTMELNEGTDSNILAKVYVTSDGS
jgi:hypothetical protein